MDEASPAEARVGQTLRDKWTLERLLGQGGMASVYVGRHKIGRLDAIKIMHPAFAAVPQLRARFEQEARAVNRFRHPGAVEIHDIDTSEDGVPFLVMELLEGEPLSAVARTGPVDLPMVLRVADEVLDVLAAAHAEGIIHRDIKPDNLFILRNGQVKVLDFGIARVRESMSTELKTRVGTTLGTVSYMSPEQARGAEIDGRADIYSVGATMYRLISGRHVHVADSELERIMKVVSDPSPPLSAVAPQTPPEVCALVDRAVLFDRERRYPDARSMQADVRAVQRGEAPVQPPLPLAASRPEQLPREAATRHEGVAASQKRIPTPPTAALAGHAEAPLAAGAPGHAEAPPAEAMSRRADPPAPAAPTARGFPAPSPVAAAPPVSPRPEQPAPPSRQPTRASPELAQAMPTVVASPIVPPVVASPIVPPVVASPIVPPAPTIVGGVPSVGPGAASSTPAAFLRQRLRLAVVAAGVALTIATLVAIKLLSPDASPTRSANGPEPVLDPLGVNAPPIPVTSGGPPAVQPTPARPTPPPSPGPPHEPQPPSPAPPHEPQPPSPAPPGHGKHHGH